MMAASALYPALTLDPANRLMNARVLGEWNTDGNSDLWQINNVSSWTVSGGNLTLTSQNGTANPAQVDLRNIASGPNLDYAFFDYLQLRLQLPANYNKDLTFSFGTSTRTGFASDRVFTIPAASLATDGAFHTYRLDLGLVVWWRDNLNDLRIQPLGTTGANETATFDYVEVGDLPGDVLGLNTNLNFAPGVTIATAQHIESKHFAIWWDPAVDPGGRVFNIENEGLHAIRALEESYQVYSKVLGYDEPFQTMSSHSGARVKLNLLTWYSGYWEGGFGGYAHMNIDTSGLQDEGVGSPTPHEYGHAVDSNQFGALAGGHWESHANYYRDNRNQWFAPLFAANTVTSISLNVMTWSNFQQDSQRIIYEDYRIHVALQNYAASLGLPEDMATRLWRNGTAGLSAWAKLATLLPAGTNIKDVAGYLLRYWPMLDFANKSQMAAQLWGTANNKADFMWRTGSELIAEPDQANWYRVPFERAPEKYAYMYHVLTPNAGATSITVNLRALSLFTADTDFRWSLAFTDGNGNVLRYSSVFAPGSQTLALNAGETQVLLIVVATPSATAEDLTSFYNTQPYDETANRIRYPYEVQIVGASPAVTPLLWNAAGAFHFHTNPDGTTGGLVENTATVASTAYVAPTARVLGTSQVLNNAKILDYAVIANNARVRNNAVVSGYAVVRNNGIVQDNAVVTDHALVENNAQIQGNAIVEHHARVADSSIVREQAIVRGEAYLWGSSNLSGYAIADYNYSMNYTLSNGVHFNHIPFDDYFNNYYAQTQTKPRGLVASYRIDETTGEVMWDEYGALSAWLVGSPTRPTDSNFNNSRVLALNGTTQYGVLDRSLGVLTSATYSMWLNPTSSDANETLLYFGSSANTFLKLTGRDANGLAHLTISVNGVIQQLVSNVTVPLNAWTHLAVSFGAGTATFYINGNAAGSTAMSFRPVDVMGADTYTASNAYYLGRDTAGNLFTGRLEDIRVYNAILTASEVQSEIARSGARIGQFFMTTPMDFNGTSTTFESGVHGGTTRTLSAWVLPRSNAATYTAIFDSYDERGGGNNRGTGIGLSSGIIQVRLDGVGLWNTGIAVTLNQWQQIAVTLTGSLATLYVNGISRGTRSYTAVTATKNYHIGFYQTDTTPTKTGYFNGQLYDARIYDSVVVPTGKFDKPPTAVNDSATIPANTLSYVNVLANDTDPNPVVSLRVSAVTQGAHGTVAIGTNSTNVTYTPVSGYVGPDTFTYTASDGFGGTSVATVNLTVAISLSTIAISPANPTLANGAQQVFNATGYDQIGNPINPPPSFTWSILSGSGSIVPTGDNSTATFTAGNNSEPVVIQASSGTVSTTTTINVVSGLAPTLVSPPTAGPNPATNTTALSVLADDAGGEATLVYTWSALGNPPAPVTFTPISGPNGSNGAKNMTATFSKAGTYTLQVKIFNLGGYYTAATVKVVVPQVVTTINVTPATNTVAANLTDQFTATILDQFGNAVTPPPTLTWSIASGTGTISPTGLYTAPRTSGPVTVRASFGSVQGNANITVTYEEIAWYKADTSGTTLIDSSGNNRTATLTGTLNTTYNFPAGVSGSALHFVSGTPYAQLPTGIVSALSDFTISAWVKIDTLSAWSRIFDFGTGQTANMFLTPQANGAGGPVRFAITTSGGGGEQQLNGPVLTTGTWYHIAITLVGSTGTLYVNGAAVASNTNMTLHPSNLGNTTLNYLGKSQYPDPAFLGSIDDFRIFSRGLAPTEVLNLAKPMIITAPAPASNPTSTSTALSVVASDITAGEPALTYIWATTGSPPAPVTFSINGTNAAKNTIATFTKPGTYNFQVTIVNPAASLSTVVTTSVVVNNAIVGRYLFYNNSNFDGNNPASTVADNSAIATDKTALLGGQTASFANYSNYSKGINGVMIDIAGLANAAALSASDFIFSTGTSGDWSTWTLAPAPVSVNVRTGGGPNGSDRITIIWADGQITNTWLRIWMKPTANTGLAAADSFFFGNLIGETGNQPGNTAVDSADTTAISNNFTGSATLTNIYDINRDGAVNATDASLAGGNLTPNGTLTLITPPGPAQPLTTIVDDHGTDPIQPPSDDPAPPPAPGHKPVTKPTLPPPAQGGVHRSAAADEALAPKAITGWNLWQLPSFLMQRLFGDDADSQATPSKKVAAVKIAPVQAVPSDSKSITKSELPPAR